MPGACGYLYERENIDLYQGDDWSAGVVIYEADGVTPADLTGYTALAQVRRDVADLAAEVACEMECTIDIANSQINLSLHHSVTELMTDSSYVWDLQLTSPADVVTTVIAGAIRVVFEVTRVAIAGGRYA